MDQNLNLKQYILNEIVNLPNKNGGGKSRKEGIEIDQFILIYKNSLIKGFFICLNTKQRFFLKVFYSSEIDYVRRIFTLEVFLLKKLKSCSLFCTPKIFAYKDPSYSNLGFILMEYINFSLKSLLNSNFLKDFAFKLYRLHERSSSYYGYPFDNYYGYFKCINKKYDNWCHFFIENRLKYQVDIAIEKKLWTLNLDKILDSFLNNIKNWIPENETISFLHGDFWIGNCLISNEGKAYIIDPASYFGSREIDLSSFLFYGHYKDMGSFFLDCYQKYYPLEKDFEKRFKIYNLYYELIMMNTYGLHYKPFVLKTLSLF